MPFLSSPISHLLPKFIAGNGLNEYSRRYPSCYFLRLPLLVYLDYIFPCLSVEDIICLRRVRLPSSYFFPFRVPVLTGAPGK